MTTYFDDCSDFEKWCEENGYDPDPVDIEEKPYKRSALCYGFVHHPETDTYASVNWTSDYYWGNSNYEVTKTGLKRVERQVTKTVVSYE
jgi:hypothetical protein